jgi:translation initiation factor 2 alpha subunit (eIF-2alpha)
MIYPELFKKILIEYEKLPFGGTSKMIDIEGYTEEEIIHHQQLLERAGYIKFKIQWADDKPYAVFAESLTYEGHEFLRHALNDKFWKRALKEIAKKNLPVTIQIIAQLISAYVKQAAS